MEDINRQLHEAASSGKIKSVHKMLKLGSNINQTDQDGNTPLHTAVRYGQETVIEYLISHGADVNEATPDGKTPLHLAASIGCLKATKVILSHGAKLDKKGKDGYSALHTAAHYGHLDITEYLISQGAEVHRGNDNGSTALHSAAQGGHLDITKYLISQGADMNKGDNGCCTALHIAAQNGHLDFTEYLICQGAEVNKGDNDGWNAFHIAAYNGYFEVTKYLISQGAEVNRGNKDGWTALQVAAQNGHLDVTTYLISHGAEVNKGDNDGWTAFLIAAQEGHLNVTKYLISQGAEVNEGNKDGAIALQLAVHYDHPDITKYLISQGADVNKGDNDGCTAIHVAAQNGDLDVTEYLISQGAEVNRGDNDGSTALHSAAQEGHLDVTKYLISQGADVNKGDNDGSTALQLAVQKGHAHMTKRLIGQGADVNKGDNDGSTALQVAAHYGHLHITKYLINQGAEVNKGDNDGSTALHNAARKGHLDVTKYLISQSAKVDKGNKDGATALQLAAQYGHVHITKYVISQGAEVNKGDNDGSTALHSAAQEGHLDVTTYLISQGAELNERNKEGATALHIASHYGHLHFTKYLISQGADVNAGANDGRTALHSAAQKGHFGVTKYLLTQGVSVNMGDRNGYTPLHIAALNDDLDIVKVLLEEGALVGVKGANGQTPLHVSSKTGSANSSDILAKQAKINGILNCRDDEGLTAIHLATLNGHTSVVESLVSHGASLNIQSHDGKTCLHEAIILSDHIVRKEQTGGKPQQISDDFYQHELSPEKALVLYLLEHGAKLDVRDSQWKLPIHYANNEVIRQILFSRLPSMEMITRYRAEEPLPLVTVSVHVDSGGKQIELADLGISMSIPPGAVQTSCEITLTSIRDPPSINSQGDESLACLGIRCEPPNMIFHKPVKIKIPHSAFIVNPDQVKPDIVCRSWDSVKDLPRTSRNRSSSSPDEPPYCRVYKRHLELYIGHCAEWWVLIPLEQQVIRRQLMCTPYIPETIEQGKEIEVHLHVHADLPGIDTEVLHEEKHQSYRKAHRSVPFSIICHSGDVTVARDFEGKMAETKLLSLKEIHNRMRHNVLLKVPPSEDDTTSNVVTVTITQSGNLGASLSIAFVIKYEDEIKSPEFTQVIREIEETSRNDLPDVDVQKIAEKLSIDDFYDLGVALGFQIQQLDAIEYKRLKDRQEAIHEILIMWKQSQLPHQNVKGELLSLLKAAETGAEKTKMTDIPSTCDISDQDLLKLARNIKWTDFMEIGTKLGFSQNKLENIKHKTLRNRKDANIQMLCTWKASQRSGPKATKTLKCILESVLLASAANPDEEENKEKVAVQDLKGNSTSPPEQRPEQSESVEPEDMTIIRNSDSDGDETCEDFDQCGGSPTTGEQCSVALPVNSLPLAWQLGKALRLDDDVIVGFVAPSDSAAMNRLACQLLNKWYRRLGSQDKKVLMTKLLQDYHIQDCNAGRDEISKKICTTPDLLDLSQRLDLAGSEILQVMSTSVSFPPTVIRHIVLQMLHEWVRHGGTRKRLLEITKAFHFNDAADKVATAMEHHTGFLDPFSHSIIDHDGGELKLDELDVRVSIPAGAIPKGMRSVVTLSVPSRCSSKIPLQDGDVLITRVIECSFTQELLKPANVALPHCIHLEQHQDDLRVSLYTKLGPDTFGYRSLLPNTSKDFHISEDMVGFSTRHLQLWALSSSNVHGVQFTCEVFQPLFMVHSQKSTLRICIAHPCNRYPADMCRRQESSLEPFYQVAIVIKFSLESNEEDIKLWCLSDSVKVQKTVPVRCLLNGECNTSNFELMSSHAEGGAKSISLRIEQGKSVLAEQQIPISIEVEPDYRVPHTRIQFASDNVLKILSGLVCSMKDARDLGYQLGFSHSTVERYLDRADSSASSVSSSGFREMLRDWRRRVRPSEQVNKLRLALEEAGLGDTAEVFFHEY